MGHLKPVNMLGSAILAAGLLLLCALPARAGVIGAELEALLPSLGPQAEVAVIVTMLEKVELPALSGKDRGVRRTKLVQSLKDKADETQAPVKALARAGGAKGLRPLWIVNGLALTARPALIRALARRPDVERVELDKHFEAPISTADVPAGPEWNIARIGAPELWSLGHTGAGVVVAAMDTGVDVNHPDLADRWRSGANSWFDPYGEHPTPYDGVGHGTQVMGIMVGGSSGGTAVGVAPDAQWIAVKVFNDLGAASYSAVHLGFQWLLDPDGDPWTDDAPDVVNNSWGFDQETDRCVTEFREDVQILKAAEIAVVFSAGNGGPSNYTSVSPANYPEGFAAGAVDASDSIDLYSSRGPSACDGSIYPEVTAPGVSIRTTDLTFGGVIPDSYAYVSGTSFASPHVAGAMALLLSGIPGLTVSELEGALKESALDLGFAGPDNVYGYGLLDIVEAFYLLESPFSCTDADGDGYYAEADCGTASDCNDLDPSIHPGASEIKHDGLDQDCNGWDLTIEVLEAVYVRKKDSLVVEATSALGSDASLEVGGYGLMKWNRKSSSWTLSLNRVGGNPGEISVSGKEGWEIMTVSEK